MLYLMQYLFKSSVEPSMVEDNSAANGITYVGYCRPGTTALTEGWIVKRIRVDGNTTEIMYADGSRQYNKAWSERANYTYKFAI